MGDGSISPNFLRGTNIARVPTKRPPSQFTLTGPFFLRTTSPGGGFPEVEKVVVHGNLVPRNFRRLAESFQANPTRDLLFCEICRITLQYMGKRG